MDMLRHQSCSLEFSARNKESTHLHALTVIEQHIAELFGDHVQVSLLALVGPGQNIELGKVRRQIVERSRKSRTNILFYFFVFTRILITVYSTMNASYCMVVKTGSSSVKNTKGSSLYPNSFIFLGGGGLRENVFSFQFCLSC